MQHQPLYERPHVLLRYVLLRCCTWWVVGRVGRWVRCCRWCFCYSTTGTALLYMVHASGCVGEWLCPLFLSTGGVAAMWVMATRVIGERSVFVRTPVMLTKAFCPLVQQRTTINNRLIDECML